MIKAQSVASILWLALLSKGLESLLPVCCPQDSLVVESLDLEASFQVSLCTPVYGFLGMFDSNL